MRNEMSQESASSLQHYSSIAVNYNRRPGQLKREPQSSPFVPNLRLFDPLVPKAGFEPARPYGHYALNVARLPFRHFG
jgi:hypothetical protein